MAEFERDLNSVTNPDVAKTASSPFDVEETYNETYVTDLVSVYDSNEPRAVAMREKNEQLGSFAVRAREAAIADLI